MTRLPGFNYDKRTRILHLSCYVKGEGGKKRRERTIKVESIEHARKEWAKFQVEISGAASGVEATFDHFTAAELSGVCRKVKPSTDTWYRDIVTSRLSPYFGKMPIAAITNAKVDDFVAHCLADANRPISSARINGILRVLRRLLHVAVDRGYLSAYPLRKLPFEKVKLPELELKRDEQAALLASFTDEAAFMKDLSGRMPPGRIIAIAGAPIPSMGSKRRVGAGLKPDSPAAQRYFRRFAASREFFLVAIETGLRREDLRQLRWEDVDLAARWIRVSAKKTEKMVAIPITDACHAALLIARDRAPVRSWVFVTSKDKLLSKSTIDDYFALAKRLAGIKRRCRFHDLRHTFGSNAASNGIPIQFIQKAMGHSSIVMVQRYARPDDEAVQKAFLATAGSRNT